jgi:signal recognition particle GTPase
MSVLSLEDGWVATVHLLCGLSGAGKTTVARIAQISRPFYQSPFLRASRTAFRRACRGAASR